MLSAQLKHVSTPQGLTATNPIPTRCSPRSNATHDLNLAEWLTISPSRMAGFSSTALTPTGRVTSNPSSFPSSLEKSRVLNIYGSKNDFLRSTQQFDSSPLITPPPPINDPVAFSRTPPKLLENSQFSAFASQEPSGTSQYTDSSSDASLLLSITEMFSSQSPITFGVSPIVHRLDGESTPITTFSADEGSQASGAVTPFHEEEQTKFDNVAICTPDEPLHRQGSATLSFMDLLREADSPLSNELDSPFPLIKRPARNFPSVGSYGSHIPLAQPQPRLNIPFGSSPLSSLATCASNLSSARSTPAPSRPSSSLSNVKPRIQRKVPPKRFYPSPLFINLPDLQLSPSCTDGLMLNQRGPLEFESDGHRYRTRSKLKNLKAEIQEREKEDDLMRIRRGLKQGLDSSTKDVPDMNDSNVNMGMDSTDPQSRLDVLASVSAAALSKRLIPSCRSSSARVLRPHPPRESSRNIVTRKRVIQEVDSAPATRSPSPSKKAKLEGDHSAIAKLKPRLQMRAASSPDKTKEPRPVRTSMRVTPQRKPIQWQDSSESELSDAPSEPEMPHDEHKLLPNDGKPLDIPSRSFPKDVKINSMFPLLYRKFPVISFFEPADKFPKPSVPIPAGGGAVFNTPRSATDLYTPRFVRGIGREKCGLCPICYESTVRGGEGKTEWLSMKFSAFNYHMQYVHGISPSSALPFSPPLAFRLAKRKQNHKNEKSEILEGHCHRCGEWAPAEGVKCVEAKLKEIYWWKHAAACHKGSVIGGETDIHLEDDLSRQILSAYDAAYPSGPSHKEKLPGTSSQRLSCPSN